VDGVRFVNDSKGTNPEASIKAIDAMKGGVILIAGGYDKGSTFDELIEAFNGKVKHMVLLGKTAPMIKETAERHGFTASVIVDDMEQCVNEGFRLAEKGDTFDWTCQYTWYSEEGFSNPYKIESNVFDTFVSEGELSDAKTETVSNDADFILKMYAVNGATSTTSSSIRFCEPFYYGIKGSKLNKMLSETIDNSINVDTAENEYFVFKYPTSLPKLKYIHMDDALNVI
jgi:hypothetical protein